jgi:YVTN family beta-propeller protein
MKVRTTCFSILAWIALAQEPAYLVLQKGASSLAYYTREGRMLSAVPVGAHPHEMVFSPDRKTLYTTDNGTMRIEHSGKGGNTVSIIDVQAQKKAGEIVLGDYYRPHGIDVDHATGRLAVTTELPDQLLLVDPVRKSVLRKYATNGKTSHMVTFGPGGKWAYVSNSGSGNVAAVNLETAQVKLIPTGTRPEGSALSKDGKELYVCNREAASITVIDTAKQQAIANIPTGKGPVRIALTPDGKTLVYALMHDRKVAFADPAARRETGYVIVPGQPVSCTLSNDGKFAFASAEENDTVYIISVADRKISGEIKTAKSAGPDPIFAMPRP